MVEREGEGGKGWGGGGGGGPDTGIIGIIDSQSMAKNLFPYSSLSICLYNLCLPISQGSINRSLTCCRAYRVLCYSTLVHKVISLV